MKFVQFFSLSAVLGIASAMDDGACERSTTVIDFETLPDMYEDNHIPFEERVARHLPDGTIVDGLLNRAPDGYPVDGSPTMDGVYNDLLVTGILHEGDKVLALSTPYRYYFGASMNFKFPEEVDVTFIRFRRTFGDTFDLIGKDYSNRVVAKEKIETLDEGTEGIVDVNLTAFRGVKKLVIKPNDEAGARGVISSLEYSSCKGKDFPYVSFVTSQVPSSHLVLFSAPTHQAEPPNHSRNAKKDTSCGMVNARSTLRVNSLPLMASRRAKRAPSSEMVNASSAPQESSVLEVTKSAKTALMEPSALGQELMSASRGKFSAVGVVRYRTS